MSGETMLLNQIKILGRVWTQKVIENGITQTAPGIY